MDEFFELRLEATLSVDGQLHLSMFLTDRQGQWFLLEDWTAEDHQEANEAKCAALDMISDWLTFSGHLIPA